MRVLLVEDDIPLNTTITNFLNSLDYKVVSIFDGNTAIDNIDNTDFNLYIIDINIPNINGLDIVKYIRQKDINSPIIIITASLELENFKIAFKNGCSEYIKKPFYLEELEIRINNLLESKENIITISDKIMYDMEYEELQVDNKTVLLRKKERKLLTILLKNLNHTVQTDIINSYVWENEIRENYPLRQLVNELRKKLDLTKNYIVSDIGTGYRFET